MRLFLIVLAALAGTDAGRKKMVDVLTKTTGTWVGSPTNQK